MNATSNQLPDNRYNTPTVRFGMYFFAVLLICITPIAAYNVVARYLEARDSINWPTAEAVITRSIVEESRATSKKISYKPHVTYTYRVADREFSGNDISMHDVGYGDGNIAQEIVAKYSVNSRHSVYYNPDDPAQAVLEPGITWRAYLFLLTPVVLFLLAVALFFGARHMARQSKP